MGLTGRQWSILAAIGAFAVFGCFSAAYCESVGFGSGIYDPGQLKPTDSGTIVKVGDKAPDFILPSISGHKVALSDYIGKKNVVAVVCAGSLDPCLFAAVAGVQHRKRDLRKE